MHRGSTRRGGPRGPASASLGWRLMRASRSISSRSGLPDRRLQGSLGEHDLLHAELLDGRRDAVAGLQPDLLVLRVADDHALGRAGEDDIARLEREVLREEGDLL